jgi:hypothetical protein
MNDYSDNPLFHLDPSERMALRGEFERTKIWVRRQQWQRFMKSLVAWIVAYVVMVGINLVLFGILMAIIPALRSGPAAAYLLLLIPPICALPPFVPLIVGIMVGIPLRRKSKDQSPIFMG